ncbi:MAG: IgiC [Alphaproteobacteria bacterium]|nr:IgiC [Alphaproteobacteria bacterium]
MVDTWGWRMKFGIVTPSTNTIVQPNYDMLRPKGVTNHIARMHIPDDPIRNDADFDELIRRIDVALEEAIDRVMTCHPDHIILGISAESIWGGSLKSARAIDQRILKRAGKPIGITQAADALPIALKKLGIRGRIAMLTPYQPTAEKHLRAYAAEIGYDVVRMKHLCCDSPVNIGHVPEDVLRRSLQEIDGPDVEAIVQFGANLPMAFVAAEAERWLRKPVLGINTTTYWHALRTNGIQDQVRGLGRLMEEF